MYLSKVANIDPKGQDPEAELLVDLDVVRCALTVFRFYFVDTREYSYSMEYPTSKVTTFTDLRAWKESHQLALDVYKITDTFPDTQRFGLTSQLQRAVVSIPSNIAEGFSRQTLKIK